MNIILFVALIFSTSLFSKGDKPQAKPIEVKKEELTGLSWKQPTWDIFLLKAIDENFDVLKKDAKSFCPNFESLQKEQQLKAIAEFFVGMSYYESGFSPVSRMKETTMGKDPITKRDVYSEGLFQLSYQDEQWIKCGFDWSKDKNLNEKDPNKTILNPELNTLCAVKIMTRQINKFGKYILKKNVYWAVIKDGGKYQKIAQIKARVIKYTECK